MWRVVDHMGHKGILGVMKLFYIMVVVEVMVMWLRLSKLIELYTKKEHKLYL